MKTLFVILAAVVALTGCASLENFAAQNRIETYQASDTGLLHTLYTVSPDGHTGTLNPTITAAGYSLAGFYSDRITFKKEVASAGTMRDAQLMYKSKPHQATDDAPAKQYVAAIKARGNTAKLYKNAMGRVIAGLITHPVKHFDGDARNPASIEWFDLQPVIMEFDASGRLVSFMLHVYQGQASFGAGITVYSSIYSGRVVAAHIENHVGNRVFADSFLRNL